MSGSTVSDTPMVTELLSQQVPIVLNALFLASVLFLLGTGLSMIYGMLNFLNLAHAAFRRIPTESRPRRRRPAVRHRARGDHRRNRRPSRGRGKRRTEGVSSAAGDSTPNTGADDGIAYVAAWVLAPIHNDTAYSSEPYRMCVSPFPCWHSRQRTTLLHAGPPLVRDEAICLLEHASIPTDCSNPSPERATSHT